MLSAMTSGVVSNRLQILAQQEREIFLGVNVGGIGSQDADPSINPHRKETIAIAPTRPELLTSSGTSMSSVTEQQKQQTFAIRRRLELRNSVSAAGHLARDHS